MTDYIDDIDEALAYIIDSTAPIQCVSTVKIADIRKKDHHSILNEAKEYLKELGIPWGQFEGFYTDRQGKEWQLLLLPKELAIGILMADPKIMHRMLAQLPDDEVHEMARDLKGKAQAACKEQGISVGDNGEKYEDDVTMTSIEIAALCGKKHEDVMCDIGVMLNKLGGKLP